MSTYTARSTKPANAISASSGPNRADERSLTTGSDISRFPVRGDRPGPGGPGQHRRPLALRGRAARAEIAGAVDGLHGERRRAGRNVDRLEGSHGSRRVDRGRRGGRLIPQGVTRDVAVV